MTGHWRPDAYQPTPGAAAAADRAIAALRERGSPAHDGTAARLVGFSADADGLRLELQVMRWALRLIGDAAGALSALCVVRDAQGRWLAGRRAPWVATWAGVWALGAGGAVDEGEPPAHALARELHEEWGVVPERLEVEALLATESDMTMLVGQAWLADDAELVRDHEHDAHAWWPADPADWPQAAHLPLRDLATMLASADGERAR